MEQITEDRKKWSVFLVESGHKWSCAEFGAAQYIQTPLKKGLSGGSPPSHPKKIPKGGKVYLRNFRYFWLIHKLKNVCSFRYTEWLILKGFFFFFFFPLEHTKYNKQQLLLCWSSKHYSPSSVFKNSYWQSTAKQHHQHWSSGYEAGKWDRLLKLNVC